MSFFTFNIPLVCTSYSVVCKRWSGAWSWSSLVWREWCFRQRGSSWRTGPGQWWCVRTSCRMFSWYEDTSPPCGVGIWAIRCLQWLGRSVVSDFYYWVVRPLSLSFFPLPCFFHFVSWMLILGMLHVVVCCLVVWSRCPWVTNVDIRGSRSGVCPEGCPCWANRDFKWDEDFSQTQVSIMNCLIFLWSECFMFCFLSPLYHLLIVPPWMIHRLLMIYTIPLYYCIIAIVETKAIFANNPGCAHKPLEAKKRATVCPEEENGNTLTELHVLSKTIINSSTPMLFGSRQNDKSANGFNCLIGQNDASCLSRGPRGVWRHQIQMALSEGPSQPFTRTWFTVKL